MKIFNSKTAYNAVEEIEDVDNKIEELGHPLRKMTEMVLTLEYIREYYPDIVEEAEDAVARGRQKTD